MQMIEQNTHTTHYATVWCDREGCTHCYGVHDAETAEYALGNLRTEMNASGWKTVEGQHYCPEHRPVVIDANQRELLP